jgi:hypothetical protein
MGEQIFSVEFMNIARIINLVQDGNDFDYIFSPKQKYYMEMPKSLVTNAKPKEMPKLVVDVTLGLSQSIYGNFPR